MKILISLIFAMLAAMPVHAHTAAFEARWEAAGTQTALLREQLYTAVQKQKVTPDVAEKILHQIDNIRDTLRDARAAKASTANAKLDSAKQSLNALEAQIKAIQ